MNPTLGNKQNESSEQKQSSGGFSSQGINIVNNLARGGLKSPFGKIGSRIPLQAAARGIGAFLAANPWAWIVLGIIVLMIVVFVIVFSGGIGGIPGAPAENATPTPAP